jgi:hypothetical protein
MTFNPVRFAAAAAMLAAVPLPALAQHRSHTRPQPQPDAAKVAQSPKPGTKAGDAEHRERGKRIEHKEEADERDDD